MQNTLCTLLFTIGALGFSQNNVKGKITDHQGNNLHGSHVHIGKKTATTNAAGEFGINKIPSGTHKLFVSHTGYKSVDTLVSIEKDTTLNITLAVMIDELQEIVVTKKENSSMKSVSEQRINQETIQKYSNQSLGDALKEVAGVSGIKTGSTVVKPVINGLSGSRVPIISNNVRIEDQEWGTEHAPNIDMNVAERITVIKGSSGLQYSGDAVGGLIILEPMQVKKDTLFGDVILNLATNGKGGSANTSVHKGNDQGISWNIWNSMRYMGDRHAPTYTLSNTGNREANLAGDIRLDSPSYDLTAFASYYNTTIGILSASHTGNATDLYNSINNKVPSVINNFTYNIGNPKQEVQHYLAKTTFCYHFNGNEYITAQYAFQLNKRLEYDLRRGDYNSIPALNLELSTHSMNIDYKKNTHDWTLKLGASSVLQTNVADPTTGVRPLIPNYTRVDGGMYGIMHNSITETLSADAGLRYDFSQVDASKFYQKSRWDERGYGANFPHFIVGDYGNQWLTTPSFAYHNISASAGIRKEYDNKWQLLLNLSSASRNPNPAELFSDGVHHSSGIVELGDLNLTREQSVKLSATAIKGWKHLSAELNPYINAIDNYIYLSPTGFETNIRGTFPLWEYRQTRARLAGIDLQTKWDIHKLWQYIMTASYVNGMDIGNSQALIDMPPLRIMNKIRFEKREWSNFMAEVDYELNAQQTHYPNNNFTTNIVQNNQLVPVTIDISTPPQGYGLLNLYTEAKFGFTQKTTTTVALSVQNILNTSYRDYLNKQRFFADELGRNIQIQLKYNF